MKKLFLFSVLFILFIVNSSAQNAWKTDSNGVTTFTGPLVFTDSAIFKGPVTLTDPGGDALRNLAGVIVGPPNDAIGATTQYFDVVGTNPVGPPTVQPLIGMGVNMPHPAFMLDITCDASVPTNNDVNISCPTCSPLMQ